MNILLTGGAGFIGSHLAESLLARGHRLVILDDFNDYYSPALKEGNLRSLSASSDVSVVRGDIRDRPLVEELWGRHRFAGVFHLAARAGVRPSLRFPLLYQEVNVEGTLVLLEAARRHGVRRFVFASSSSVYGNHPRQPLREDDPDIFPESPYGLTKLIGEHLCRMYHRGFGISVAALRFFTAYGPRQRPDMAIHKFTRRIWEGEEVPVFGDGNSRRDYTYVADIVAGAVAALEREMGFEVFNLGGGHSVTLRELLDHLGALLGRPVRTQRLPEQAGDMRSTWADISKARAGLGFQPRTSLEDGLRKFIDWFKESR